MVMRVVLMAGHGLIFSAAMNGNNMINKARKELVEARPKFH
jgi:hypothetical protein